MPREPKRPKFDGNKQIDNEKENEDLKQDDNEKSN